jgi:hypothetical protein
LGAANDILNCIDDDQVDERLLIAQRQAQGRLRSHRTWSGLYQETSNPRSTLSRVSSDYYSLATKTF